MIKTHRPKRWKMSPRDQAGSFLGAMLIIIIILVGIGITLTDVVVNQYTHSQRSTFVANAQLVAEAGIEQSVQQLNTNDSFAGYPTSQQFFDNTTQGKGVFTTTITNGADSNAKTIVSVGRVYRRANANKPVSTRTVKVTVVGTGSEGYSVQSGPGGLILGGSASITNSDVFVNGTLSLSGTSRIGTYNNPVKVSVANQACPTTGGSTYPQTCSTDPITLGQSTAIYGTVCATNQTSYGPSKNKNILPGSTGQGLQLGCVAPATSPPTYDRAAQIAAVTTTGTSTSNTYACQSYPFNRTWPANLKLTGNVSIGGSCNVTIKGNVYITGDLTINGASKITVDDSVGTTRPVILVDGKISINGSGQLLANSSGTGIQFISFKSNASCGSTCTSLTGAQLYATQSLETINVGGAVNLPGMIFQAYWGKVTIGGGGNIGAAVGQTVDMSGAGTVTFGTKLSSGARTWTITSYQQQYQ